MAQWYYFVFIFEYKIIIEKGSAIALAKNKENSPSNGDKMLPTKNIILISPPPKHSF